eukprot:SAG31_NODE_1067_length_10080_cov_26.831580_2_plen_257_part_00
MQQYCTLGTKSVQCLWNFRKNLLQYGERADLLRHEDVPIATRLKEERKEWLSLSLSSADRLRLARWRHRGDTVSHDPIEFEDFAVYRAIYIPQALQLFAKVDRFRPCVVPWQVGSRVDAVLEVQNLRAGAKAVKSSWRVANIVAVDWAFMTVTVSALGKHKRTVTHYMEAEDCLAPLGTKSARKTRVGAYFGNKGYSSRKPKPVTHSMGKPVAAGATGLKNLGNTCYMNSVLQVRHHDTTVAARLHALQRCDWAHQ